MKSACALLCCCLAWLTAQATGHEAGQHPLLDLARELEAARAPQLQPDFTAPDLRSAEHALRQAHPPADADCARSLGASVFADLHSELAQAHEARGDFAAAAQDYRHALACAPRSVRVLNNLAQALFDARDFAGAREYVQRALAIDPRAVYLSHLAANIDFIEERWADAVTRFRYAAASEPDRTLAAYMQIMYWLAQRRGGVPSPELVARRHTDIWPEPLLLYLQDQYTESELVARVREGEDEYATSGRDERLCEALYYVGEAHWAEGRRELARDYFAAAVNIKLIRFHEHGLAMAEIAKLRPR
ncbi:MAG TPA: tetratricopeptide repeat protein [Steroidobacteraceae bacterium]|nr:tetratricopeptide repeat protein [Steroidobacteraceae bacterium]